MECAHCGCEISTYTEALEALEAGGRCPMCDSRLDLDALEVLVDGWDEEELVAEGSQRSADLADFDEEEDLFEGVPDFGDDGEEDEDPLI
jgi:hypothetical protein